MATSADGLWASPVAAAGVILSGEKTPVDRDGYSPSVSADGSLQYLRRNSGADQVVIVDRAGKVLRELGKPSQAVSAVEVSPDGRRAALEVNSGLWVYDFSTDTSARLVNEVARAVSPRWSTDSKLLGFVASAGGTDGGSLYIQRADSSEGPQQLRSEPLWDWDWSHDRDKIVFATQRLGNQRDIYVATLSSGKLEGLATTKAAETHPVIDPSGRYLAYASDATGRFEIYVRTFPGGSGKWVVTSSGGEWPRWSAKGDELFYLEDEKLMSVSVSANDTFRVEQQPHELFVNGEGRHFKMQCFAPMPNGQQFVIPRIIGGQNPSLMLVENWPPKK